MAEILYDEIPSLDLADFTHGSAEQKKAFVAALGEAYTNIGFVSIKNRWFDVSIFLNYYQFFGGLIIIF